MVSGIIHTYWKVSESKGHGKEISADGIFARLDELQLQKAIRLHLQEKPDMCTRALVGKVSLRKLLVISVQDLKVMEGAVEME